MAAFCVLEEQVGTGFSAFKQYLFPQGTTLQRNQLRYELKPNTTRKYMCARGLIYRAAMAVHFWVQAVWHQAVSFTIKLDFSTCVIWSQQYSQNVLGIEKTVCLN